MKRKIRGILRKLFYQRYYNWWDRLYEHLLKDYNIKLTKEEIKEIDCFHKRFANIKLGYTYYKTVKAINNHFFINEIKKIEKFAQELHERVPFCSIIGWDICLDEHNEPLLIEANLLEPGILYEQLCTGPIFGERTEEVLSYVTLKGPVNMWINHFRKS